MDFITSGIIASSAYDIFKHGLKLTGQSLKERLAQWVRDEVLADAVAEELTKLKISNEMSEIAITRRLDESADFQDLIRSINTQAALFAPSQINSVTQTHSGSGDNVAGNKIVNNR